MRIVLAAFLLPPFLAAGLCAAPLTDTTDFLGTIGQAPVSVELKTHDDRITGEIIYLDTATVTTLDGAYTAATKSLLTEAPPGAPPQASIHLTIPYDGDAVGERMARHNTQPIHLAPIACTYHLITADSARYSISTGYVQFLQESRFYTALNAELRAAAVAGHATLLANVRHDTPPAARVDLPAAYSIEPRILFASDTLVSIRFDQDNYRADAVHNWITFSAVHIAWKNNKLVHLTRSDLLDTHPRAQKAFTDLCIHTLTTMKVQCPDLAGDKNTGTLNFTPAGLLLSYDDYDLGAFSQGEIFMPLPYASLTPFIPNKSPLAVFLPKVAVPGSDHTPLSTPRSHSPSNGPQPSVANP